MKLLIDHVSKRFKDKEAVNNISLKLTPGVWGLLGANGAGKTTLMRIIAGIMQPTSGDVVYDGVPIRTLGEHYRDIFGYLPQEFGFYQEFTVKDYLAYVAALKGLPERQSWRRIHELLERVSLLDVYMAPTIMEIDPEQIDDYYSVCEARIISLMAMEQPDSPSAQRKAVEMYRQIEKPFEVYPGMSSTVMDYQNIMSFLVLLFCVVIAAPVFSAGYQSGADDILRCTKHGRTRLGIAKLVAAFLISGAAFVICAIVYILAANSLFGWDSAKTSIQMVYSIVTLIEMNIGELQLLFAAAGLLSVLASVSFTLFLSSKCKSTVASLAAALVFCIAPVVVYMTVPGVLSTWICSILPASGTSIQASILYAIIDFQFLNIGGLSIWTPYAMIGACIIEIPLFSFLAVRSYCKHTVN